MSIEGGSEFGRWKMSSIAVWIRYRVENNLCGACGEHALGTGCPNLRGAVWTIPEWADEILEFYKSRKISRPKQ